MENKSLRVLIAEDEPITRMDLREMLEHSGYDVVGEAADGFDALELCKTIKPDLVLMDIKMPLLDGLAAGRIILEENLSDAVILITAYSERGFIDQAKDIGISGYLVKPVDEKTLVPSIELAVARSREVKQLRNDIEKVSERLENRGIIEKAKGLLMEREHLSEQDAYDYIRKISCAKNISMRRVSEIILLRPDIHPRKA